LDNQGNNEIVEFLKKHNELIIGFLIGLGILLILAFKECATSDPIPQIKIDQDICLNVNKKYSDFILDSNVLKSYLTTHKLSVSIQTDITEFYRQRDYQYAWFNQCGMASAASTFHVLMKNYQSEFESQPENKGEKNEFNVRLDSLLDAALEDETSFLANWSNVSELEWMLSASFLSYADKVYGGSAVNTNKLSWFIPRNKKDYRVLLDSMISSSNENSFREPLNPYYVSLKKKLVDYKKIEQSGQYPFSIINAASAKLGDTSQGIVNVKKQLFLLGDLTSEDHTQIFNSNFESAIKSFQNRMGLSVTGSIEKNTLDQLNIPIADRIKQIMINLERLRWVPSAPPSDYLLVNIPEFRLHIFEKGNQIFDMNVIVGKTMNKTVIFEGNISSIVLNPYWNIPSSIVNKEILAHIHRDPNYLSKNNMEAIRDLGSGNLRYRQKPGPKNALGRMKFLFPNHYSIYLHDAPAKRLFEANTRAFSHGCIRVAEARKLALYILNKKEPWSEARLDEILNTNRERQIPISPPIPVFIAYFTAWVDQSGVICFRNDIYGLDKRLALEIFGE
jgi:L,D-transpeptidase YcbB